MNRKLLHLIFLTLFFSVSTISWPANATVDDVASALVQCRDKSVLLFDRVKVCTSVVSSGSATDADIGKALFSRARVYKELKEYGSAIRDYTEIIERRPDAWPAFHNRANIHRTLGNYRSALNDYNEAIRLKPDHEKAIANRGVLFEKLKQKTNAANDFQRAYDLGMRNDLLSEKMAAFGLPY